MKEKKQSQMAEKCAYVRAIHLLYDNPIIFEDPFAIKLISSGSRRILNSWILRRLLALRYPWGRYCLGEIVARNRYSEDQLEKAIARGIKQYVIIGAGLDSFALRRRDLEEHLKIFELDHPTTQRVKKERLDKLNINLPKNLEFVPIDFEKDTIAKALGQSSYLHQLPAFFSWMGTVNYLTRGAIFKTLRSLTSFSAPGSEIIFDYPILDELLDPSELRRIKQIRRFTKRCGEPWITSFDPIALPIEMKELGFTLIENLSPHEQKIKYFKNRKDGLTTLEATYFAHFRIQ
ncbi:MAG: class I SAM-dependent methyltransferase [Deltaproteobacteria bacterium]|nr:class I SAM-dependent methyltransferase [Deltaproteobacteria bacterium]MBM4347663.1 class I SAM-dependent methyltransferase [Deltaproteobacteria bacterium]